MVDYIITGAGTAGCVIAARLSEDPDRAVLLIEAGPDYSVVEQTPADLLNTWVSAGAHDWDWSRRRRPLGKSRIRAARLPAAVLPSMDTSRCAAHRATSTNGLRRGTANGASRRSCRFIASSKTIATPAAISTESADRYGSSARAPRRGSRSIALFSTPRARQDTRKSGTTTILSPPASAPGPATAATVCASRPRSAISHPHVIA